MRDEARLVGSVAATAGALAVLFSVLAALVDAGAGVTIVASLLSLAHAVDDPERDVDDASG